MPLWRGAADAANPLGEGGGKGPLRLDGLAAKKKRGGGRRNKPSISRAEGEGANFFEISGSWVE
jgi:hypothetical protein